MTEQDKQDLIFASSYYLFETLPNHFVDWKEDKLNEWIEEHAWQPFEHWEGEDLWIEIEKLADGVREYINGKPKEIPQEDWVKGYNKWKKTQ